jgi:hypothetical protein
MHARTRALSDLEAEYTASYVRVQQRYFHHCPITQGTKFITTLGAHSP